MQKESLLKKVFSSIGCIVLVLILTVLGYVGYVFLSYSRIEDNLALKVENGASDETVKIGTQYTVMTHNIGFGAYTPDFTFFMDGGTQSWANSKESVIDCINGVSKDAKSYNADFVLFQEVDTGSTRSYHTDQASMLKEVFPEFTSVFAQNYHSAFLMYPFTQPHGASNSGILTLSNFKATSALRRSLPISDSFSKILDLDRAYSVTRIPTENGKELVLYNTHMSAYGGSDEIRAAQMGMLFNDMQAEYEKGNYAVCGGDFNHDLTGDSVIKFNEYVDISSLGWAQPFPVDLLPENISRATDYVDKNVPTCRNCDVPYGEDCLTLIVDGFLVSDNVEVVTVENKDNQFRYSDHNPVVMDFILK